MMTMLSFNATDIIVISGKRHSGKTVLAKWIIDQYLEQDNNVEIFDINNEYQNYKHKAIINKFGLVSEYKLRINELVNNAMSKGNKILVFDDIDTIISQNSIPDAMLECIIRGRHRNIGMILIFRRINSMHKQIIFNADHFFIYRSKFDLDIRYLQDNLGTEFSLNDLNKYEFLYLNAEDEEFKAKLEITANKLVKI